MENLPQQSSATLNTSVDNDAPMDEFEFRGKQQPSAKNMLAYLKFGLIAVTVIAVIVVGVIGVNYILANQPKPTQTATSTSTPAPTPTSTEIPIAQLPPEYQELQKKIDEYDKLTNTTSETRTRLNIPVINVIVTF